MTCPLFIIPSHEIRTKPPWRASILPLLCLLYFLYVLNFLFLRYNSLAIPRIPNQASEASNGANRRNRKNYHRRLGERPRRDSRIWILAAKRPGLRRPPRRAPRKPRKILLFLQGKLHAQSGLPQ